MRAPSSLSPASGEAKAALQLFFLGMVRGVPAADVTRMVAASWTYNPDLTLQILMQARDARDARDGKGEKAVVYAALLWLRENKPATYVMNLLAFLKLGYFKDLLQVVVAVRDNNPRRTC